ncbi:MAG: G-D-S-L family lipolytic protein [Chitinophagaceae bacterium]|nr:G-D-S-L family lipolytic protein [Chitinophagaceae bacterium]
MIKKPVLSSLIIYFLSAIIFILPAKAQPFIGEIAAFKKQDSVKMPPKNAILFVGSSSFRMWTNVQEDFPMYSIINRGFGGSSLTDVIRFADQVIFPYQPAQVVIYCGENDLASSDTVSAQIVFDRFQQLFSLIRKQMPETPIAFVSIKPSPSREHLLQKVITANELIKTFLKKQTKTAYIDVFSAMIDEQGKPKPELFIDDRLHMNKKGYAIWLQVIEPHLIKK